MCVCIDCPLDLLFSSQLPRRCRTDDHVFSILQVLFLISFVPWLLGHTANNNARLCLIIETLKSLVDSLVISLLEQPFHYEKQNNNRNNGWHLEYCCHQFFIIVVDDEEILHNIAWVAFCGFLALSLLSRGTLYLLFRGRLSHSVVIRLPGGRKCTLLRRLFSVSICLRIKIR